MGKGDFSIMLLDRILSRYTIRTKVLTFVLPFVVSICAVGLIGLYASGLLQQRMEISNGTMRSLSGFRDVSSAMGVFLSTPSEETRDTVVAKLGSQQEVLQSSLEELDPDAAGRANMEAALAATTSISGQIGGLWDLYQTEMALGSAIDGSLNGLMAAQMKLSDEAAKLQRSVRYDENTAKSALREADRLNSGARFLASLADRYLAAGLPEQQLGFLKTKLLEMSKMQRTISTALPDNQKIVAKNLADAVSELGKRVKFGDVSPENIDGVRMIVTKFQEIEAALRDAAEAKSTTAIESFAKVDVDVVETEEVLGASRTLISSVYDLRLRAAGFLADKNEATHDLLLRQIDLIAGNLDTLGVSIKDDTLYNDLSGTIAPALEALKKDSAELVAVSAQRTANFAEATSAIDRAWNTLTQFADIQKQVAGTERNEANTLSITATALGITLALIGGFALVLTLQGPISQITSAMRRLAEGDLDTAISGEARGDEIGDMARALGIFKDNALAKVQIEEQSEEERVTAEAERRRNDVEKQELDRQIQFAVSALASGLERLASGDISTTIDTPFIGRLEQLRNDFNLSLMRLRDTIGKIMINVAAIQGNGRQMSHSADELSRRTETQAASLEETAAAVDEITVTVRSSAERAREANLVVTETRKNAENSAEVVKNAIAAMGRIENASQKIEQIIDVIEDIAFQTNLLALNAGIEAARAGEAGKGFAVVAQEVRELAQRSGSAAQEIKNLINTSTAEVGSGAKLVQETGSVLSKIGEQISTISQHVDVIATASQDQSAALEEVNDAVNQMDQMTQQNAAMVEETSAASRQLAEEADVLLSLVQQFRIETQHGDRFAA